MSIFFRSVTLKHPVYPLDRILTISRVVIARIRGDPETRANLEMNGGGPIKIGAF